MASGYGRRLPGLVALCLLTVAACSSVAAEDADPTDDSQPVPTATTNAPASTSSTTTATVPSPTTTIGEIETTTTGATSATTPVSTDVDADVRVPEGPGPFPAVVLVHGGGWVAGDPSAMADLASSLTEAGFLTVNTRYLLATQEAGYPGAVDDVACAARFAANHPDSSGSVTVLGHSAGAHLAALVALTGDRYATDCPYPESGLPARLVGLAGPYDVDRLGLVMLPFFGGGPNVEPEAWEAGNPQGLTPENTSLSSLVMYGENDALVDSSFAIDFHEALIESGSDSTLELVEGARHMDLRDPDWVTALIVAWLER